MYIYYTMTKVYIPKKKINKKEIFFFLLLLIPFPHYYLKMMGEVRQLSPTVWMVMVSKKKYTEISSSRFHFVLLFRRL